MPAPTTVAEFVELVRKSALVEPAGLDASLQQLQAALAPNKLAAALVGHGLLTYFQAEQLLQGRWRGFNIGKYRILERLGAGGMGIVYLCEHKLMGRRVAIKVLPVVLAKDPWFLEHFYREAQAAAALDHPNIVRAHDIDQFGELHFLVMEYVDGTCLQEIVDSHGPLSVLRAAHYVRQAAHGLQHAHEVGIAHRDIKPGNLLLDRQGTVKILDMGLAHFFLESQKQTSTDTKKAIVGTGDYLAPEQVVDSDDVDIRADIYGLGATFYFLLAGKPPFDSVSSDYHKLLSHLTRSARPLRELRPEVPEGLAQLVSQMIAKNPWERPQTPAAVIKALAPWTQLPIPPPPVAEMPHLSPAARRAGSEGRPLSRPVASPERNWAVVQSTERQAPTTPSPASSPGTPAAAETQRVSDTSVKPSVPAANSPPAPPAGAGSTVTFAPGSESPSGQDSSLLRACQAAEAENEGKK